MKISLILFVLFSFFIVPLTTFSNSSNYEVDCWHAKNHTSIPVDIQFESDIGWTTIVHLPPGASQIFDIIPEGYNPRVVMILPPFDIFTYPQDCRTGMRDPDPQWYIDYQNSPTPVPITGYFLTPVSVASGSYNWNMTLNLSQSGHIDAIQDIQLWNAFHIDSATTSGDSIVLSITPNTAPLAVVCGIYTVTVPASLIQGNDGISSNPQDIVGSFEVTDCPTLPPDNTGSTNTGSTGSGFVPPTASGSYIAITYKDSVTGATYVDLYALFYLLVYASGVSAVFYGLFRLFKKALTGR